MSVQSVGPKTPAPRREVWDHIAWALANSEDLRIPRAIKFIEGERRIVALDVDERSDCRAWAQYLGLTHWNDSHSGVFYWGELLGWVWNVDCYQAARSAEVANLPLSAEVAQIPRSAEVAQ